MWPFRVSNATQKAVDEIVKKRNYVNWTDAQAEYEKEQAEKKQKRIDELTGMIKTMMDATLAIDFLQMQVVSIERVLKEIQVDGHKFTILTTIVGHLVSDKEGKTQIKEWMLHCSQEHHEQLVADFKDWIKDCNSSQQVFDIE
jgi:hypothetical protein